MLAEAGKQILIEYRATRKLEDKRVETFTVKARDLEEARLIALDRSPHISDMEFTFTEVMQ